ncbi:uncharacterized protein K444DRAFT_532135 [Hyaloscypha bicolor E]|uniref:Zn(2)-C6 fungal-type domain-containing protein n=1 Tax=Hyaloscypha bicolor E TaxID=1095630 RepID=A0A2J6T5U6_9HELO|nr:uncharacterized protein K444DRAFT_532135 [Hyaloscypha bicolor E]PMD58388.1 hypothetical protein K444DRAFT_532135 [Hyaloscypha bicolor E]
MEGKNVPSWDESYGQLPAGYGADEPQRSQSPHVVDNPGRLPRGVYKNRKDREETAQTRGVGACIRCRMQRIRCVLNPDDPRGVCITCMKPTKFKASRLPCLRYKLTEVRLFTESMAPGLVWSTRWQDLQLKDINVWASSETRTIKLTQDYVATPLTFQVRQFVPLESDMLDRRWAHGSVKKSVTLPPYAFANMREALEIYKDFINREGTRHLYSILDRNDGLVWATYGTAIKASNSPTVTEPEKILLKMIVRLWVASRMTTKSERICGDDILDMPQNLLDETHPMHGQIPIPPVMGAQIETLITHNIMARLKPRILEQLYNLITANKPSNWLSTYLCTFILLHDCSLKVAKNAVYARKHGMKTQFANMDAISEIQMGANILLAYFHYSCKGYRVFEDGWKEGKMKSMASLNEEQAQFIQKTADYVKINKHHFAKVVDQKLYEHEHYFIAQLYDDDWKPKPTV